MADLKGIDNPMAEENIGVSQFGCESDTPMMEKGFGRRSLNWKTDFFAIADHSECESNQIDECWTHQENFLAESPYFTAAVEKEMHYSKIVFDNMKQINDDISIFIKVGKQMVTATRSLSAHLQSSNLGEEALNFRKNAFGPELSNLFDSLGKLLTDIATMQEKLGKALEANFDSRVTEVIESDLKIANDLRIIASSETDTAERNFANYLHGSKKIEQWKTKDDLVDARVVMQKIRVSQTNSELERFNLINHFVTSKNKRDIQLCCKFETVFRIASKDLQRAWNSVGMMLPSIEKSKINISNRCSDQAKQWEERYFSLIRALDETKVSHSLEACNFQRKEILDVKYMNLSSLDLAEGMVKLWDTPHMLASNSRFRRIIPKGIVMEGWLYEKKSSFMSRQAWIRKWYMLKLGALYVLEPSTENDATYMTEKICDIVLTTVRELDSTEYGRFCFQLMFSNNNTPVILKARGPGEHKKWVDGIRLEIEDELAGGNPLAENLNARIGFRNRIKSCEIRDSVYRVSIRDGNFERAFIQKSAKSTSTPQRTKSTLTPLVDKVMQDNPICADCSMPNPDWVSLNLGILVCINCSGVHRSLGVHISKVRSLALDSLTNREARLFLLLGNKRMNMIWEKEYDSKSELPRPRSDSDRNTREKWIITKYIKKQFLDDVLKRRDDSEKGKGLYKAAAIGDLVGAASFIAAGGNVNWRNNEQNGATPLQASMIGLQQPGDGDYIECTDFLLLNGADANMMDATSRTSLDNLFASDNNKKVDNNHIKSNEKRCKFRMVKNEESL